MEVANMLEKQTYFPEVLFKHEHPANTGIGNDSLYLENNKNYDIDKQTYNERKAKRFGFTFDTNSNNRR